MTTLMTIPKTQYPSMEDARLAQQARTDPQAFAELYRRWEMPGLYQQQSGIPHELDQCFFERNCCKPSIAG
jgi:hypothetical protein